MRIAICDDDSVILEKIDSMVRRYMENKKLQCTTQHYHSGEELIAGSEADPPNIILLDVEMGEMNGIETARQLRENGLNRTVIIFITALRRNTKRIVQYGQNIIRGRMEKRRWHRQPSGSK